VSSVPPLLLCLTQPVVSDSIEWVEIRFTQAARRHRIGRASARYVMASAIPTAITTDHGNPGWFYLGPDERDRELEIVAVQIERDDGEPFLLVIHVMPTNLRGNDPDA
jgi:hypothetical protein